MKEKVKIGLIGGGARGEFLLENTLLDMDDIQISAICEPFEERRNKIKNMIEKKHDYKVSAFSDYHDLLNVKELDAIVIACSWHMHVDIAIEAMQTGKYVGMEVGGAFDINDCWKLVDTYEKTKAPFMMLENCCYGRNELLVLNMVRQGLFGEIVHCAGGYCHDLRGLDLSSDTPLHYRHTEYSMRNCENYPTHEMGPIAKVLGLNRGNKMLTLSSQASKACGLHEFYVEKYGADSEYAKRNITQGDIITTTIKCAQGQTIVLTLDTTLPRAYYSRNFTVRGTKGMYEEARQVAFLDGDEEEVKFNLEKFYEKYDHPIYKEYNTSSRSKDKESSEIGHESVDYIVFRAFIESIQQGINPPIDVYDAAAWMCITPLSEQSIALGGTPVPVPDFTRGKWERREVPVPFKYSLDL